MTEEGRGRGRVSPALTVSVAILVAAIAEGLPESLASGTLPKFRPDGILLVHCGGAAGLFSAMIGGWAGGELGSQPVLQEIRP